MQEAAVVLSVLRERGRRGLPCMQLYRQMFNKDLYLLAYGNIYPNKGAMTPGSGGETADGMSEGKIDQIIELMRHERYRFPPARRIYIPKKNGKLRPLGLPDWSGKLVGEVIRLLLEAYYEPSFSDRSHGFRKGRGCHTALRELDPVCQRAARTARAWNPRLSAHARSVVDRRSLAALGRRGPEGPAAPGGAHRTARAPRSWDSCPRR